MHTSPRDTLPTTPLGRTVLAACIAFAAASLIAVLIVLPGGTSTSSDDGAPLTPWWMVLIPAGVGIALTLLLPWRRMPQELVLARPATTRNSTIGLLLLAAVFPLSVGLLNLGPTIWYPATKFAFLTIAAGIIVVLMAGPRIELLPGVWRWWAPCLVVAVWTALGLAERRLPCRITADSHAIRHHTPHGRDTVHPSFIFTLLGGHRASLA